ncbi:Phosphoglycolate phosphatase [uncultured archaeon]|nr:Phosphoglycolate phosphatase [uncultured archaeon]
MVKAVLFDVDGTLIDSIQPIYLKFASTAKEMGLRVPSFEEFRSHVGRPWDEILLRLWPDFDPDDFTRVYRRTPEVVLPFPNLEEVFTSLSGRYRLGILTSRGKKSMLEHMKHGGIDVGIFEVVLSKDDLRKTKPDPEALRHGAEEFGLPVSEVLYVGDALIDARCAKAAGMPFVAVESGGTPAEEFRKEGFVDVIKSVAELSKFIEKRY